MALIPTIPGLEVRPVDNDAEMFAARRLHARCYVDAGYVDPEELSNAGLIDDPWVRFSDYFAAFDTETDELVGTCRLIRPSVQGFPAFQQSEPLPDAIDTFVNVDPSRCVEVSALATPRNGIQNMAISASLYGQVWRESVRQHRAYMLALMDDRLLRIMRRWFEFPFEAIGHTGHYMGSASTPVAMYVPRTIDHLQAQDPEALQFFSGEISFSELDEIAIDLRDSVPEHKTNLIELDTQRAAFP